MNKVAIFSNCSIPCATSYSIPMVRRPSSSSVRPSSTMLRHLLRHRLADQSQILCGASLGRGNEICPRHVGHMTKMAATPIYGKNPSNIFSGTGGPIFTKLGMEHRELQPIIVWSNDDYGVPLTYFTARSNLVT